MNTFIVAMAELIVIIALAVTSAIFWRKYTNSKKASAYRDWDSLATGVSGDIELERAWIRKFHEIFDTFCVKQADYGPNNIAVGGESGVALRLGDKVSRAFELTGLRTGTKKKNKVGSEAMRDTWMDIADYGVIGLLVADGDWSTITPEEAWGSKR